MPSRPCPYRGCGLPMAPQWTDYGRSVAEMDTCPDQQAHDATDAREMAEARSLGRERVHALYARHLAVVDRPAVCA